MLCLYFVVCCVDNFPTEFILIIYIIFSRTQTGITKVEYFLGYVVYTQFNVAMPRQFEIFELRGDQ